MEAALLRNTEKIAPNHSDEAIIKSIEQGFDAVENSFLDIARKAYTLGFLKAGKGLV